MSWLVDWTKAGTDVATKAIGAIIELFGGIAKANPWEAIISGILVVAYLANRKRIGKFRSSYKHREKTTSDRILYFLYAPIVFIEWAMNLVSGEWRFLKWITPVLVSITIFLVGTYSLAGMWGLVGHKDSTQPPASAGK